MPFVTLTTNLSEEKFPLDPKEFNKKLANFLAKELNRPVSGMFVHVIYGANFSVDANFDPAVMLDIKAFERFGDTNNIPIARKTFKFLEETLGLKTERILIHFHDIDAKSVGYGGTTADEFLRHLHRSDQFPE